MSDYSDLENLMLLESTIAKATNDINKEIISENDLEIILIGELNNHPEVSDESSIKNKFIKLCRVSSNVDVRGWFNDWLRHSANIKVLRNTLRQLEGRRDSLKKKISLTPQ